MRITLRFIAACKINHSNVVAIFDKGLESESGRQFLVTEFVDGITLKDYLSTKKPTLYELAKIALATGELPFQGSTPVDVIASLDTMHNFLLAYKLVRPIRILIFSFSRMARNSGG